MHDIVVVANDGVEQSRGSGARGTPAHGPFGGTRVAARARRVPGVLATGGCVSMRVSRTTLPVGWPFLARPVFFLSRGYGFEHGILGDAFWTPGARGRPAHAQPLWRAAVNRAPVPPALGISRESARSDAYLFDTRLPATERAPLKCDSLPAAAPR